MWLSRTTVRIECENESGQVVLIDLHDALFVPNLRVNLFSIQNMRQAYVRLEYTVELGTIWMLNDQGEYIGSLHESRLGRPTLNCRTILCEHDDYPLVSLSSLDPDPGVAAAVVEPVAAAGAITGDASAVALDSSAITAEAAAAASGPSGEALPAISVDLLYRRTGHTATSSLQQLVRVGLVRGLEGGTVGELGTCRGCMLGKPMSKPHRPKDPSFRTERPLQLIHADLAGPIIRHRGVLAVTSLF